MSEALDLDPLAVRRAYLSAGGDYTAAARALGCSRQAVAYHVRRANRSAPLAVPRVSILRNSLDQDDAEAVARYVRAALDAAGIVRDLP